MELEELISRGIEWLKAEPVITIAIMVIVVLLLYFKTKPMLKLLAILLAFAFLFYIVTLLGGLTSSGVSHKQKMIQQERMKDI